MTIKEAYERGARRTCENCHAVFLPNDLENSDSGAEKCPRCNNQLSFILKDDKTGEFFLFGPSS